MISRHRRGRLSRRWSQRGVAIGLILGLLVACGGKATDGVLEPHGDGDGDGDELSGDGDGDGDGVGGGGPQPAGTGGLPPTPPPNAAGGSMTQPPPAAGGSPSEPPLSEGGLLTSSDGTWRGYAFATSSDASTVMPTEFLNPDLCVTGVLAPGYEEWALLGWNIAQVIDPETLEGGAVRAIPPGGAGVNVQVVNYAGSGLRLQIQSDSVASEFWCASLPSGGGLIPWSSFTKECWAPGGEVYDGVTPIAVVAVQTYASSDLMPTAFDFCVLELGPG